VGAAAGFADGAGGVVLQAVAATPAINNIGIVFSFANLIAYLLSLETDNRYMSTDLPHPRPYHLFLCFFIGSEDL
jgi:hypothetical protein